MAERKKVVLVTGASSGLGKELALAFVRNGSYRVILAARRTEMLESVCDEIGSKEIARPLQLDVSASDQSIDSSIEQAWQFFGSIDVLVNNAGIRGAVKSPLEQDEEEWNKVFNTNTRGTWLVSKAVAKRMVTAKKGGSIINISSSSGDRGVLPGGIAYAASKAAVNRMTQCMALELGKFNIRVNAIAAGIFRSEITDKLLEQEWVHQVASKIVPLGRFGHTSPDLTSLVLLLAHDSSAYVTGALFHVDGGQTLAGIPLWSSL